MENLRRLIEKEDFEIFKNELEDLGADIKDQAKNSANPIENDPSFKTKLTFDFPKIPALAT